MDAEQIEYLEKLTALHLDKEEREGLAIQLAKLLDYVRVLETVDTSNVEPTSHVVEQEAYLRADEPGPSLSPELALREGPRTRDGFFIVPPVVQDASRRNKE